MENNWTRGTLAELATVVMGTSPSGDTCNQSGNGMPLLNGPTEFTSHSPIAVQFTTNPVKTCQAGDILFCVRGSTTGRMNWADRAYAIGRGLAAIRHRKGPDYQPFLRGVIQQHLDRLLAVSTGSTFPSVSRPDIENLPTDIPPTVEQRAIAHVLGTLDDKIELNRRMNETLEGIARAIFKSWFVDFDSVRAKAEGRDPGLPKHIADLFPDDFENSPDGLVPNDWQPGTLADFSDLNPESWSKSTRPHVVRYVDLSNTKWGRIESIVPYSQAEAPSRAQRVLRPLDSIVGTVRPGNGSFSFITEDGLTGSTGFAVLRPRRPEYAEFVYLAATARANIESLQHLADGAAYPAVRPDVVAASATIRPTEPALEAFSRLCKPLFDQIATNYRECATLADIRDALLPKLLSGEIELPEAILNEDVCLMNAHGGDNG